MSLPKPNAPDWAAELLERYAARIRAGELCEINIQHVPHDESDMRDTVQIGLDFGPIQGKRNGVVLP